MANCCEYTMQIVGQTKESVERLLDILNYKDKEFFIYRVQYVDTLESPHEEDGLWVAKVLGDVAWSAHNWVNGETDKNHKSETGAYYTNLPTVCKELNVAVEIWTRECGFQFQEYIVVNNLGEVPCNDCESWELEYDENMEVKEEKGGFDSWGEWSYPHEIFVK